MTRIGHSAALTAVIGTAAIAGVLATSSPANAEKPKAPTEVSVVQSVPVAVTGSVDLAPGNAILIANPANSPVPVIDVSRSPRQPFQVTLPSTPFANQIGTSDLVTVPAGQRLVVQHVSASINVTSNVGIATVNLNTGFSNVDTLICHSTGKSLNGLNHFFACGGPTNFYAQAGDTVRFVVQSGDISNGFYRALVSGYFEAIP